VIGGVQKDNMQKTPSARITTIENNIVPRLRMPLCSPLARELSMGIILMITHENALIAQDGNLQLQVYFRRFQV